MQSEAALRAGAMACFTNAQELYEEAKLLYEHAQSPRSVVLALIGAEEFAKAVVYTVAALLPKQRHLLPPTLDSHPLKHHICMLAEAAQIRNTKRWGRKAKDGDISDYFRELARWGLDSVLDDKKAKQYYRELRHEIEEDNQSLRQVNPESEGIFRGFTEPDLKEAALYVELEESGEVNSPSARVSEHHVVTSINALLYYLEEYAALPTVVEDDQCWRDFAERVRNGLSEAR
jgi:AbiV family abortive infection protein